MWCQGPGTPGAFVQHWPACPQFSSRNVTSRFLSSEGSRAFSPQLWWLLCRFLLMFHRIAHEWGPDFMSALAVAPTQETQLTLEMKSSRSRACQSHSGLCLERGLRLVSISKQFRSVWLCFQHHDCLPGSLSAVCSFG